jgi:hypothetical protein
MRWKSEDVLATLDQCSANFTFPMLDNGYVYLAATRLSLHRTEADWGMVIEVFGYSPRAGLPDTHIYTFASSLQNRDSEQKYKSRHAYENYLANNPHNESRFAFPLTTGDWQDRDSCDYVADGATAVILRGQAVKLPSLVEYGQLHVFELCRFLADLDRESVLSNSDERRISLPPEMNQILQLEEWNHPNLVEGEVPSQSETFQQLAQVLITGDCDRYRPATSEYTMEELARRRFPVRRVRKGVSLAVSAW